MADRTAVSTTRYRSIPATSKVLVAPGEPVMPDTPIARTEALPGKLWQVDASRGLRVDAASVPDRLVVQRGDRVRAGDVVAAGGMFFDRSVVRTPVSGTVALVSKTRGIAYVREDVDTGSQEETVEVPVAKMLGVAPPMIMVYKAADANMGAHAVKGQVLARFGKKVATSPIYGKIASISPLKGTITIEPLFRSLVTLAYIKGRVEKVVPGEAVEVSGEAVVLSGTWGLGGESCGRLHVVDGDLADDADLPRGSVVAARGTASHAGLLHAAESGARGVILGWLSSGTAVKFAGGLKNMGVTGDESVPFPLVLTEGFLERRMRSETFDILQGAEGSLCSLRGVTHIRAGVVRPEILIFPD